MLQIKQCYLEPDKAVFAQKREKSFIQPRPFGLPRSLFTIGFRAVKHTREICVDENDVERSMYGAQRGVGSYR